MINKRIKNILICALLFGILLVALVLAAPSLDSGISDYFNEDQSPVYTYNFTQNVSGTYTPPLVFSIESINSSEHGGYGLSDFTWITINASTGVMTFNSTRNNETGAFNISIHVVDTIPEGVTVSTNFTVNATNDVPSFTNIDTEYNLTKDASFLDYINATDEEEHYALFFNISFFNNCTLATGSTRTNCSIFTLTNVSNTSTIMNFTPAKNDVGTYWANVTVRDWGESYPCPHAYCDNTTYKQNKSYSSGVIVFNVFSALEINASDCQNKIFQENQSGACQINITSKGESDLLNISSNGSLRNYTASVSNTTWFYPNNSTNATNFTLQVFVNVTPQKTEVGNWTINFTVHDLTFGESLSELIYVSVNRTLNDAPDLIDVPNINTSINLETRINLTVYDDDLLVPDKLEGYNETTSFNVTILNQSDLSQELSLSGFDIEVLNMPVSDTNRTEAKIQFTPNSSEAGNYTINITINDEDNSIDSDLFNLTILTNEYPVWNQTSYSFNLIVNSSFATTTSFGPINLTGDGYVTDTGDTLTFTNDSSAMPRFNLSSGGMISFTPYKQDVGSWNFSVIATDLLGLQNETTFRFNITNINSDPDIKTPLTPTNNVSIDVNSNMNVTEDNYTVMTLFIQDEDFRISSDKKDYYNESLSVNLTIEGNNTHLFTFVKDPSSPIAGGNQSGYTATFTPNKTDVGDYNITINVTDASNSSDVFEFNLTVNSVNDAPVLFELSNQTTAVNRSFYYDINASDEEDGNDSQGILFFIYNFISGQDIFNTTTFNSSSGEINITLNSSQGGIHKINITVNDSSNLMDSQEFWIYVYDIPNITYPSSGENFSLQENITSNLTFRGNHSIQDNLTYLFYLNNILKYNLTYYGNDTNLTWQFTPNMTDETHGLYQNLTVVVYPTTNSFENNTDLNYTINFNVNITHTNSPVVFSGYIGDKQANYDTGIEINLSQYFSDDDYTDENYNQTVNFTVTSSSTPSYISSSVSSDWILTLSSLIAITEILNITGNDSSTNATSNDFEVQFTTPTTTEVPTPSGGSSSTIIPVSLKIIMPDPVSAYKRDRIVLPITLHNNGGKTLSDIDLTSIIVKDNLIREDIAISFDKSHFSSLNAGEKQDVVMTIDVNTEENGTFEITINASVKSPKYMDWGKLYLTIKEGSDILEKLLFTEEFLQENPECIELEELLDEAREFFKQGDFVNTVLKIQEAINGCKNAISQQARIKRQEKEENELYRYLLIVTIAIFLGGVGYYSYKRIKLKRSSGAYLPEQEKNIFNKQNYLIFLIIGAIGLLFALIIGNIIGIEGMTGFTISDFSLINQNKFNLGFIFMIGVLGFLIFLKRSKIVKFVGITKSRIKKRAPKNRIKSLIKKRVYTSLGDYLGRVDEVNLTKNKIDYLKIRLEGKKRKEIKRKGIIVKYRYVKSVGEVVIIRAKIEKGVFREKKEIKND